MKPSQSILFISVLTIILASILAEAQSTPDEAIISDVQLQGSGCEETTAAVSLSPDAKDLSILFDNYSVEIGEGSANPSLLIAKKNCQIFMDMNLPRDWQFAFKAVDYRGFMAIPASAWAFHRFTYVAPNQLISSMREASFQGEQNTDYTVHFEQSDAKLTWSPCGQSSQKIQLLSQLAVQYFPRSTDRSLAQISLDSADTSIRQHFSVEWRKCGRDTVSPDPDRNRDRDPGRPPRYPGDGFARTPIQGPVRPSRF